MAKLLILMPTLPFPPRQGASHRNWGMVKALYDAGHELCLLCAGAGEIAPELSSRCLEVRCVDIPPRGRRQRMVDWLIRGKVDLVERLRHPEFRHELDDILQRHSFDAIQVEGLEMTAYLSDLVATGIRLVYDAHNAEAALQASAAQLTEQPVRRFYSQIQAQRLSRYETELCSVVDEVIAVSAEDAAKLKRLAPTSKIRVIPNAIEVNAYAAERVKPPVPTLVYSGKMDYRPNVDAVLWFYRSVWPRVLSHDPQVLWQIVGSSPDSDVISLADEDDVEVTGTVKEILPFLASCTVYIAPIRMGSGTRLKLLEAMAAGCAIVATPLAASGLTGAGDAFLVAETADDFAKKTIELLSDSTMREKLGHAARKIVTQQFDWCHVAPMIRALYE